MGLSKEMEFAREQPVKWFMWSVAVLTDPSLSELRVEFVKPISLVYVVDDIFDVCGTLDELILFTKTVQRYVRITSHIIYKYVISYELEFYNNIC